MTTLHTPDSLGGMLSIYSKFPEATLYAGGTDIMRKLKGTPISGRIINLEKIQELKHISRTESYLEIGSGVSLNRLLEIGKHIPLHQASPGL